MASPGLRDHHALAACLHARSQRPFDWGSNDRGPAAAEGGNSCVHFAAAAVEAQTGRNVMAELPKWTSERGAKAVLARRGGLVAATDGVLRRIPAAMAQRGDIVAVEGPRVGDAEPDVALLVVEGKTLAGPDPNRVRRLGRLQANIIAAWSAG